MTPGEQRAEQRRRDYERRLQAERLQDRADRLARQRERDREWRKTSASSKFSQIGWLIVIVVLGLLFLSGGQPNGGGGSLDSNVASADQPIAAAAPSDGAEIAPYSQSGPTSESSRGAEQTTEIEDNAPALQSADTAPSTEGELSGVQQQAAAAAFSSGRAERWQSDGAAGYAVPSDPVAGCRNITISNDADGANARIVRICS